MSDSDEFILIVKQANRIKELEAALEPFAVAERGGSVPSGEDWETAASVLEG